MDASIRELERQAAQGDQEAAIALLSSRRRRGLQPMLNLREFAHLDRAISLLGNYKNHIAIRKVLQPEFEFLAEYSQRDWQGADFAFIKFHQVYILWRDYFGSCSGCDFWASGPTEEEIVKWLNATLSEGNTKQFWAIEDAIEYMEDEQNYGWDPEFVDMVRALLP